MKVEYEFMKEIKTKTEDGKDESKNYPYVTIILQNDNNLGELLVEAWLAKVTCPGKMKKCKKQQSWFVFKFTFIQHPKMEWPNWSQISF